LVRAGVAQWLEHAAHIRSVRGSSPCTGTTFIMSPLARRVLRSLRRRGLIAAGERIAIALSGGSDSVALAFLVREIDAGGELAVAGLLHLNHGLRGKEADDDERFCRALAERIGWPIVVDRVDAAARARGQSHSTARGSRRRRVSF